MDVRAVAGRWLPEALPQLRGWGWYPFLAVWVTVLGFSLCGSLLFAQEAVPAPKAEQIYGIKMLAPQNTGVATDGTLVQFPLGPEARAAGVRSGLRVIAIDGRPLDSGLTPVRTRLNDLGKPDAADFTMRSADGKRIIVHLTRSMIHIERGYAPSGLSLVGFMQLRAVMTLLTILVAPVALAILLLMRRSQDPLAPWISLTALITILGIGPPYNSSALGGDSALSWAIEFASPLAGWMQIATLALFPDARFRPRWTWAVLLGSLPLLYFMRVESTTVSTNVASFVGTLAAVAVVVARFRTIAPGLGRQQIRWALFGFAISLLASLLLIPSVPLVEQTASVTVYVWLSLGTILLAGIGNVLLIASMALGVMRYRLYDADAAISRSVSYGMLTLALIGIFAGSQKVIQGLGEQYLGSSLGGSAGVLSAMVAASLVGALRDHATKWAERWFQGGLVQLRDRLPSLVSDMRETATPAAIAEVVLARLERGARVRCSAVIVGNTILARRGVEQASIEQWLAQGSAPRDRFDQLHRDRDDPLFPLRVPLHADSVDLVGWLLLGSRPDGSFYGREERKTLHEIAAPVARALAGALAREQREMAQRHREEVLNGHFEALRRLVHEYIGFGRAGHASPGPSNA